MQLAAPLLEQHAASEQPISNGQPTALQAAGVITVPELVRVRSPLEEEYGPVHKPVHTCSLRSGAAADGNPPMLLAACPRELPPEQAAVWARGVLGALRPRRLLAVTTLPAMHYRGPGSPADEDLVFSLSNQAATGASSSGSPGGSLPPPLPQGTLVGGLPAALVTGCELSGVPALLVVGVQQQQVPDAQFLYALGQGTQAALASLSGKAAAAGRAEAEASRRHQLLGALSAAADAVYRSSASASIFA